MRIYVYRRVSCAELSSVSLPVDLGRRWRRLIGISQPRMTPTAQQRTARVGDKIEQVLKEDRHNLEISPDSSGQVQGPRQRSELLTQIFLLGRRQDPRAFEPWALVSENR
jgi:hypothetical protein